MNFTKSLLKHIDKLVRMGRFDGNKRKITEKPAKKDNH